MMVVERERMARVEVNIVVVIVMDVELDVELDILVKLVLLELEAIEGICVR